MVKLSWIKTDKKVCEQKYAHAQNALPPVVLLSPRAIIMLGERSGVATSMNSGHIKEVLAC